MPQPGFRESGTIRHRFLIVPLSRNLTGPRERRRGGTGDPPASAATPDPAVMPLHDLRDALALLPGSWLSGVPGQHGVGAFGDDAQNPARGREVLRREGEERRVQLI